MKRHLFALPVLLAILVSACADDWLTTTPQTILTDEQVWNDPGLIRGVLADYYDRVPQWEGLENGQWPRWSNFDEAMTSGQIGGGNTGGNMGFGSWGAYNGSYNLLRDLHVAMDGIADATSVEVTNQRDALLGELRFLRAWIYFELVKRHGGVPLVTEQLIYDFSGDPSPIQLPRAAEADVYDFIGSELDAIRGQLGNAGSQTRANEAAALALKSRAMLYAASIAQHNSEMASPITLPGDVVGIPQARAQGYYQQALDASRDLINLGTHQLVQGSDPVAAFHSIFVSKGNSEVIFAKDYAAGQGKNHWYTMRGIPFSLRVDQFQNWGGSEISAVANVAETFDYLDGTPGSFEPFAGDGTVAGQANWTYYDEIDGIFEGKDPRFFATLYSPGGEFAGQPASMQAGVMRWNDSTNQYDRITGLPGSTYEDGGLLTGVDGPLDQEDYRSASGLMMKKYLDPAPGAGMFAPGSETWWVIFRLGEMYLNAAEAALELGLEGEALDYVNALRQRAGFPANSLTSLDRETLRSERWSELAYEDHRLWDQRRWRTAHQTWNGDPLNPSARLWVLFPFRVVRPGHPNDGKFVYERYISVQNTNPRNFRMGNYYTEIPNSAIDSNPNLIRNPFH